MLASRVKVLIIAFFLVFFLLNVKFIYWQIISYKKCYVKAANQRLNKVKLSDKRGSIYDRNLIPLVNQNPVKYGVIFPEVVINKDKVINLLTKITNTNNISYNFKTNKPFIVKIKKLDDDLLKELEKDKVLFLDDYERYGENNLARHIIGYTAPGDGHGRTGIEKAYDEFLYSNKGKFVGVISDAFNHSIEELGMRYLEDPGFHGELNVKLTLDFHIQKVVEECMDKHGFTGAVVVLKVDNGDVLAMASRPQFNQNAVDKYIHSASGELINRALSQYNAGSIFKIVVSAAGLEKGSICMLDTFNCEGLRSIQGKSFKCSSYSCGGHGYLDLINAFSLSCNSAFIDIGLRTGKEKILGMARRFGFGNPTKLTKLGLNEAKGRLPNTEYESDKEIANIAIGQGEILVTPLQVASMVATIANDGVKNEINLVDSIIDSEGKVVKKVKLIKKQRIISKNTATKLKIMMESVTEKGTGKKANIPQFGGSAGKTGTAQTGWVQGKNLKVHAWFAGYFPRKHPQYALVVFIEDGKSGPEAAAPIFGEIAAEIMKLGRR